MQTPRRLTSQRGQALTEWAIVASACALGLAGFWNLPLTDAGQTAYGLLRDAFIEAVTIISMVIAFP